MARAEADDLAPADRGTVGQQRARTRGRYRIRLLPRLVSGISSRPGAERGVGGERAAPARADHLGSTGRGATEVTVKIRASRAPGGRRAGSASRSV